MITKRSLKLFKKAAKNLPAYRKFVVKHGVNPDKIKRIEDYATVPITTKKDYLQPTLRKDLLWSADRQHPLWFCSTSGSTGEPYYFPRRDELAARGSYFVEDFLNYSSHGKGSTLVLMGFGMGVWIGGLITLRSFEIAADRLQTPISFLPTGYNKTEVFKALKKLSPEFDQTILVGYPPFIKEVVDEAKGEGIDLSKLNMRLMFAAEAFTETFRKYVCEKAGITNLHLDTLNIYGSADMGAMAYETPLSILVRQLALDDALLYQDIFGQIEKTPTLAQYNPEFIEFEQVDGQLVLNSDGALPLLRYAIGDHGGVFSYDDIRKIFKRYRIDLAKEVKKAGIAHTIRKQPFVFVYERTDLSATLHGIIIYPEFIKEGLLTPALTASFTERFTMSTKHDIHHNQFIQVNVELQKGVEPSEKLEHLALKAVRKSMIEKSSEFAEVSRSKASQNLIQIVVWPNGHPRYFAAGTKQKWVEKT
jgi:phenylacetate-CoA ligase